MAETKARPPVVVVLGHVDHGKTTLLDYIRKTKRADREVGGITQDIGAYEASVEGESFHTNKITFIDTPGHEAFSRLRARGASVADIAVLVIDATDSIMPQTREAISVIKSAEIPFIVAINKIDREGANIEKVKKDLLKEDVQLEDFGGKIAAVPISAKLGTGVSDLLEAILFVAASRNFTYSENSEPEIYVIEVHATKAGPSVSAIIKNGHLTPGENIHVGPLTCKVRALLGDNGERLSQVLPSQPFVILGFKELPEVGAKITKTHLESSDVTAPVEESKTKEGLFSPQERQLNIVLKVDSHGSLEAIEDRLLKNDRIHIVSSGVGEISKSDIFLAKVASAVIVGFSTNLTREIMTLADQEKVVIKTYKIIYELIDELEEVSTLIETQEAKKKSLKGEAKIKAVFVIDGVNIAGVEVTLGKLTVGDAIELYRDGKLVTEGKIATLKQQAKTTKEVKKSGEAGIGFEAALDFRAGDVIKSYSI